MVKRRLSQAALCLALMAMLMAVAVDCHAWTAVKPIIGPNNRPASWETVQIPADRIPLAVDERPDAVGCFGYPDENIAYSITPKEANVDTAGWNAKDYLEFQTSFQGMEVKPIQDYSGDFQFDLIDKEDRIRTRKVYQLRIPYYGRDGIRYKNLVYFFDPPDLKGMSILLTKPSDPNKTDDQWIYLPALRKVRRIAAAQKMDSFGGTDMTNDQIDRGNQMWEAKITRELTLDVSKPPINNCFGSERHKNQINGKLAVEVEMVPKNKDWPISKEVVYYNKESGHWYYEETYDKGGKLVKILLPFMDHMYPKQPIYWTYGDWYAHDLRTNHKTMMYLPEIDKAGYKQLDYKKRDWSNYIFWFDTGYSPEYLTQRFMMRGTR